MHSNSTLLFGVITGPTLDAATQTLMQNRSFINGVELRLDYFNAIDLEGLKKWVEACALPVMFTVRGNLLPLEELCALKPAYLDLEYQHPLQEKVFKAYPDISFISSFHDFQGMPDLEEIYAKIQTPYAHLLKIAVTPHSSVDTLKLVSFVQKHKKLIGIAMGELGVASRILARISRTPIMYACLDQATAPGQLSARELSELYHFHALNAHTEIFALIGDPVDKSLGAHVHNAVFKETGVNAVYLKMQVTKEELPSFFKEIVTLPFKGLSVTMPLKEEVISFLDEASADVQEIGACNTIKILEGKLHGYNTDGIGALDAIEQKMPVIGKHLLFLGAGGAAKALIFEANKRGATLTILNRTPQKAEQLAKKIGGAWEGFDSLSLPLYDAIINCTPENGAIKEEWLLPGRVAMDIVYVPKHTHFLSLALRKECQIIFGYETFFAQAIEQQKIWFSLPTTHLQKIMFSLYSSLNI